VRLGRWASAHGVQLAAQAAEVGVWVHELSPVHDTLGRHGDSVKGVKGVRLGAWLEEDDWVAVDNIGLDASDVLESSYVSYFDHEGSFVCRIFAVDLEKSVPCTIRSYAAVVACPRAWVV
jgi:hypothetical protein